MFPSFHKGSCLQHLTVQYVPFCHEAKERLQHIDGGGVRGTTLSDRSTQRRTPEETQHPRPRCCCMRSEYRMSILPSLTFYFHTNAHMSASGLRTLSLVWALLVLQTFTLGLSALPAAVVYCRPVPYEHIRPRVNSPESF